MLRRWLPIPVFLLTLLLYLRTVVPGIYVSDFVEFQYQPALLGLPHPNGFPFYMVLGWLGSHVPVGSVAWRMNVLSAVGGALAVAVTTAFAQRLSRRASVGLLAGGLLALSPTFWYYSLAAERYTLNIALLAGVFWTAWEATRCLNQPEPDRRHAARLVYLSGILLGLGLATHPSDALVLPFWLGYLFWQLPELRRSLGFWLKLAIFTGAPLLLFVYVPWRWQAFGSLPLVPGVGRSEAVYRGLVHVWYEPALTFDLLGQYVMGLGGYATRFLSGGWQDALRGTWVLEPYWSNNLAPVVLVLAGLGLLRLLRLDAALALAMAGFGVMVALMTAYITQGKNDAYLTPTFWVIFFSAAFSLDMLLAAVLWLLKSRRRAAEAEANQSAAENGRSAAHPRRRASSWLDWAGLAAVSGLLMVLLWSRYPESDLSRWTDTRNDWEVTLAHPLDSQAALLAHWSDLTPLWYMQQIEGKRQDLLGLFPPDPDAVIQPWLEHGKSLYLAAPLNEYAPDLAQRYRLMPWGKLVRILLPEQNASCPRQSRTVDTPAAWPFAITSWDIDPTLSSKTPATLRFCWQARSELPPDTFLSLRLRQKEGEHELNINQPLLPEWLPKGAIPPGEEGLAVMTVRLPLGTPPGDYVLELTPYRLREDDSIEQFPGAEPISLGLATVDPASEFHRAALTDETVPAVPLQTGPLALRAWRVSDLPVRPGDPVQIELLWQVREQPTAPLTLSLGFRTAIGGKLAEEPALMLLSLPDSAQPGTLVRTVHTVPVPRGRGDRSYWVEPNVQEGDRRFSWFPTGRLLIDQVRVKDRPHLDAPVAGAGPALASFGELADLADFKLEPASPRPGDALQVTLLWQPRTETNRSYSVFVHLLDKQGQIVAQHDGIPANGTLPTDIWLSDEIIADTLTLPISAGLPAGQYDLRVGLYDPTTGQRLPVVSTQPVADGAVLLSPMEINR